MLLPQYCRGLVQIAFYDENLIDVQSQEDVDDQYFHQ